MVSRKVKVKERKMEKMMEIGLGECLEKMSELWKVLMLVNGLVYLKVARTALKTAWVEKRARWTSRVEKRLSVQGWGDLFSCCFSSFLCCLAKFVMNDGSRSCPCFLLLSHWCLCLFWCL